MELYFFSVSVVLIIIWGLAYIKLNIYLITSKGYFFLLLLMALAGIVLPMNRYLDLGYTPTFSLSNTILFAFLLLSALYPWIVFDKGIKRINQFIVNPYYYSYLRTAAIIMILLSIYAMAYTLPYAIIGYTMGAGEVRAYILDDSILPDSPLTTVAVGVGFLAPLYIVMFFLCLITPVLKKYSAWMFITSLTYLVTSAPAQARDGFIMIPLTYYFVYRVFRNSLDSDAIRKLNKLIKVFIPIVLLFLLIITVDRFYKDSNESLNQIESMIAGTWGYFFQQPYVFDVTIQHQVYFHGISYRFPLLGQIMNLPPSTNHILDFKFEWMFGTMYASFYSATGWSSLIIASLFFMLSWALVLKNHIMKHNYLGLLVVFSLYLYFLISGLFYLRLSAVSVTITYLIIIVFSYFLNNIITVQND